MLSKLAVASLALVTAAGLGPQQARHAGAQRESFYAALRLEREGKPREAAEKLIAAYEMDTKGSYAPEALGEAARIFERKLFEPRRALELYGKLLEQYPQSRQSRRAMARVKWLSGHLDAGEQVLAEYMRTTVQANQQNLEDAARRLEKLLDQHPNFSLAVEGRFWIASALERAGKKAEALKVLEQIAGGDNPEASARALGQIATMRIAGGDFDGAEDAYRKMAKLGGKWRMTAEAGMRQLVKLERERALPAVTTVSYCTSLSWAWVFFIASAWRRRKRFSYRWLVPTLESWHYLGAMMGLYLWASGGTTHTARALAAMGAMTFAVLLPAGLYWRLPGTRPGSGLLVLHLLVLSAGVLSAALMAIQGAGMMEQLLHTIRFGVNG